MYCKIQDIVIVTIIFFTVKKNITTSKKFFPLKKKMRTLVLLFAIALLFVATVFAGREDFTSKTKLAAVPQKSVTLEERSHGSSVGTEEVDAEHRRGCSCSGRLQEIKELLIGILIVLCVIAIIMVLAGIAALLGWLFGGQVRSAIRRTTAGGT